ncbi:hypothetical protein KQI65_00845 [bacterium]|nr:hypothetical protein [bacterium]
MKSGRIFWGTLFVIIGVLGILNNYFALTLSWDALWKLWPLLLVFLGISTFLKDSRSKWIVVGGVGLIAGIVLFSSVQKGCNSVDRIIEHHGSEEEYRDISQQVLTEHMDSIVTRARFQFEGGAGRFEFRDTTSDFVHAEIRSSITSYTLRRDDYMGIPRFRLSMNDANVSWEGKGMKNRVYMYLNPTPEWELDIDGGAASMDFDLRPYIIRTLDVEAGAASIDIRLGERADTCDVSVETGASSVTIHVPESVGCEVHTESALSSKSLPDFRKLDSGHYRSENFEAAAKKMFISVESGLSSIKVKRYDAGSW